MDWKIIFKNVLHVLGLLFIAAGMCLTLTSIFTTEWQTTDFGRGEIHYHGLWRYCEPAFSLSSGVSKNEFTCYVKADMSRKSRHPFLNWQIATLALLVGSCCKAFVGALFACIGWCVKFCTVGFAVVSTLCTLCSGSAIFIFYRWSQDVDNQTESNGRGDDAQQVLGKSFYTSLGGLLCYFMSSIFALFCTILVFVTIPRTKGEKSRPRITISTTSAK
uniref:Uncharacterized protein n=1 Tax=Romanomermis culicivorax TaxID=13658 RepID=A0A915KJ24_ROMCU